MDDKIFIDDIEIFAKHGLRAGEKTREQRFLLSICATFDGTSAKVSDDIANSINYEKLLAIAVDAVKNSSFNIIERLSKHVADRVFAEFGCIVSVAVTVKKFPDAMAEEKFSAIGFSSTFYRNEE